MPVFRNIVALLHDTRARTRVSVALVAGAAALVSATAPGALTAHTAHTLAAGGAVGAADAPVDASVAAADTAMMHELLPHSVIAETETEKKKPTNLTSTPTPNPTVTPTPTAPPSSGQNIYLGATVDGLFTPNQPLNFTPLDQFQQDAGKSVAIINWYQDWGNWNHNPPTVSQLQSVAARGAVPMITWCPEDTPQSVAFPLTAISAGQFDSWVATFAQALKAYGGPVLLRFAHEMNGNWYQWGAGVNGNTAAQYVAAWRHVHDVFVQQAATNVKWVWSPNALNGATVPFGPYYPGDAYVDWLGLDGYNWGFANFGGWESFTQVFSASYQAITTLSQKPLMLAEFASSESGGSKATWVTDALTTQILSNYPRIQAAVWFNINQSSATTPEDWQIESSTGSDTSFHNAVASPRYLSRWP